MSDALAAGRLRKLTLAQLEKEKPSSVYVLNKTNPKGALNFNVSSGDEVAAVRIPVTWIPVDLSHQVPTEYLLKNKHFRRFFARGDIHIVANEDAEQFFSSNKKAREEQAKVLDIDFEIKSEEDRMSTMLDVNSDRTSEVVGESDSGKRKAKIESFLVRASNEPAQDIINELEASIDEFTKEDINMLMTRSQVSEIKQWAGNALTMMED